MSTILREPELHFVEPRRLWERVLSVELSVNAELLAYAALILAAFLLHFWDLGSRALHHDESLHATYSYYLFRGQGYHHDPLMHGPVLFHLTAFMYLLFGASDATARFAAALAGTALVGMPFLLRRWLGRLGALATSALLLGSPALLYYSRLIREDIFVALWTAGLFIAVWRYSQSRQTRWLYLAAAFLALDFANKEITFMLAAILLIYLDVRLAADLAGLPHPARYRFPLQHGASHPPSTAAEQEARSDEGAESSDSDGSVAIPESSVSKPSVWPSPETADGQSADGTSPRPASRVPRPAPSAVLARAALFVALMPIAWAVAALWSPLRGVRRRLGLKELPAAGDLLVVLGCLTLPQLGALVGIPLKHLGYDLSGQSVAFSATLPTGPELVADSIVISLLVASFLTGLAWARRRWLLCAAIFYGIYVCLFTTFFTNGDGFGSGIWNSLHYWLSQQDVQRGSQPVFYYLILLPAYEYLALAFAVAGILLQAQRRGWFSTLLLLCAIGLLPAVAFAYGMDPVRFGGHTLVHVASAPLVLASMALTIAAVRGDQLRQLLVVWFGGLLFALSVSGEKMPWLELHLALPLILLAGLGINDLLASALAFVPGSNSSKFQGARPDALLSPHMQSGAAKSGGKEFDLLVADGTDAGDKPVEFLTADGIDAGGKEPDRANADGTRPRRAEPEGANPDGTGPAGTASNHRGQRVIAILLGGPLLIGIAVAVVSAWGPGQDGTHAVMVGITLSFVLLLALIAGFTWPRRATSRRAAAGSLPMARGGLAAGMAGALLLGLLAPLSLRTALALSFLHGDTPYDMLVYTQTSPDVPKIMHDIDQYAQQSGQGYNQPIVVDANDAFTWPWAWYLRDYRQVNFIDLSAASATAGGSFRPPANAILLLNSFDRGVITQFQGQFGTGVPYHHRWWFPEDYRATTLDSFLQSLKNGATWVRWWGFLAAEHGIVRPEAPFGPGRHAIGSVDAVAFFPAGYKPGAGIMTGSIAAPAPKIDPSGTLTVGGTGAMPGAFLRPVAIAVDGAGNFYVADSQNNRIQKFDPGGRLLASSENRAGTRGALKEPWGVAVDARGNVFVADTWNYRIVKLDSQLRYLNDWGYPEKPTGSDSLLSLYGPRDIAIEADGNLLVSDTGNDRVIEFTPDGRPLGSFGTQGSGPGQFQEPVGLAVAADGTIWVADTWNGRVQVFSADKRYLRSLSVTGWDGKGVENKPYLALLPNGNLLITQPDNGRLEELNPAGAVVTGGAATSALLSAGRPIGVAIDAAGRIYISDAAANTVSRHPPGAR